MSLSADTKKQWDEILTPGGVAVSNQKQAEFFIRAFMETMGAKMEEVYGHLKEYNELLKPGCDELEEFEALRMLEKLGRPIDKATFTKIMKETIDLDASGGMSFIEFALYWYELSADKFVEGYQKPRGTPEYLAALDAVAAVQARRDAIASQCQKLEALAEKGGVKGNAAKNELEQIKNTPDDELSKLEIKAQTALKKAIKTNVDPFEEEKKRVAAEEAAAQAKADAEREAGKAKLAAKMAAFQ